MWAKPRKKKPIEELTPPKDKHARYRRKLQLDGRCPRCGKECAPFSHCAIHLITQKNRNRKAWRKKHGLPVNVDRDLRGGSRRGRRQSDACAPERTQAECG